MKVAVQQDNLQDLAKTLQEQLLAAVPSGHVFLVKCAVNNDELMILTQHPIGVTFDTETIFQLLEEALQFLASDWEQRVQCFLRVVGEKRPYAQCRFTVYPRVGGTESKSPIFASFDPSIYETGARDRNREEIGEAEQPIFPSADDSIIDSSSIYEGYSQPEYEKEEVFDPLAGGSDLLTSKSSRPIKPILLGAALVGIVLLVLLGSSAYLLTRPCVMSECKELQTAKELKIESKKQIKRAKSETQLVFVQQKLETASLSLGQIPRWSGYYSEVEELKASLSEQSAKINKVVTALKGASLVMQKTQRPAKDLEELKARQKLWQDAIAPLAVINSNHDLYELVQPKLVIYRGRLLRVNQQLLMEQKWFNKLNAAKAVANVATKQESTAKSLQNWQKVQSTWQVVINALNIIPGTSSVYQQAQDLLKEYKPKLARARDHAALEQLAFNSYQKAKGIGNQAKLAERNYQWQTAVMQWRQALQTAKQISRDSFYYSQAQSLIQPYSIALEHAQQKLQTTNNVQRSVADLKKTCKNKIQICTFNVDNRAIIVQLTPAYDQVRQSNYVDPERQDPKNPIGMNQHWQNLQDALAVISDNADLPLLVYDSQGRPVYTRSREG